MTRANFCPRDLADMCSTAGEIAIDLAYAGTALGDAFEGLREEADARRGALALLYSARAGIADLIAEIETDAARLGGAGLGVAGRGVTRLGGTGRGMARHGKD